MGIHKHISGRLSGVVSVVAALLAWSFVWLTTQSLFMGNVPVLSRWLLGGEPVYASVSHVVIATLWCAAVVGFLSIGRGIFTRNNFAFLKLSRPVIIGYVLLAAVAIYLSFKPELLAMPGWLQVILMIVGTASQDLPAFGYMQTAIEAKLGKTMAACIVAAMFMVGHFVWMGHADALIVIAAVVFAFARRTTGTIYLTHMIHLGFYLLTLLFV